MSRTPLPCPARRSLLAGFAFAAMGGTGWAGPAAKGLAVTSVLELFTSQGCSSCPPADVLFASFRGAPGVLALSMPVTIWDHLGWKDTLAQSEFSNRQKRYAYARGDRQIYTPQAIVNGTVHCVGSDAKAIEDAQAKSVTHAGVLAISPVLKQRVGGWTLMLPDSPLGRPVRIEEPQAGASERQHAHAGSVSLVTFQREHTVEIRRGENSGRMIRYGNIVRSIMPVGEYSGAAASFDLPAIARADADEGFAVIVQAGSSKRPGAIVGAVEAPRL